MSKKVLILSTSPRRNSNSEALAEAFARGAEEGGHQVELLSLRGKKLGFCQGCFACQKSGRCILKDDMQDILPKMEQADVLAFATPIYYYEMSGQMKTLLDRGNPLYVSEYLFRDVYFLASAAEDEASVPRRAIQGLEGWIECFPQARLAGTVFGGGVTETGEMDRHPEKLRAAFELGRGL